MALSLSNVRGIQYLSQKTVTGFLLLVFFYLYNVYGTCILHLHKRTRPSKVDSTANIHPSACISPWGVVIERNVTIGENVIIKAHTSIMAGVTIQDRCVIGDTGFQIYRYKKKRVPIVHTGYVFIMENVRIEAGSCIDRALFRKKTTINAHTIIGENVKVGHNIIIGKNSVIGNNTAIGGNSTIGDNVNIGEGVVISNRINIDADSTILPGITLTRDKKRMQDEPF